jgi:moderate conductance mechanosensitive channel
VMREIADGMREDSAFSTKILEPIEIFGVDSFGENAVVIKARLKTVPIEQWAVGREYRRRLKKAFDERGIEIPFPHRTLYWGEASKPFQVASPNGGARQLAIGAPSAGRPAATKAELRPGGSGSRGS